MNAMTLPARTRHGSAALAVVAVVAVGAAALWVTSTSSGAAGASGLTATQRAWEAGTAVVVVTADVVSAQGPAVAVHELGRRPGVISVSGSESSLRIVFGRQAFATDIAQMETLLRGDPALRSVAVQLVQPVR
jgi:hypothetical protein